jgi:RNase P/RNase MRP subunit p30
MYHAVWAVVREGQIELLEPIELPEGAPILVTLLTSEGFEFWQQVSQASLGTVWDHAEDDIYALLLERGGSPL